MTSISDVNNVQQVLDQYGVSQDEETKSNELGRNEFLELMIAQLNNQDPLSPQENGEFIAELAQFSTVEGIEELNGSMADISAQFKSNQALQASSLVGKSVSIPDSHSSILRQGDLISGSIDLPQASGNVKLALKDDNGSLLKTFDLGPHSAGEVRFRWDGLNFELNGEPFDLDIKDFPLDENGVPIPYQPGEYRFEATSTIDGQSEKLGMALSARVDSVTIKNDGELSLNLAGGRVASLNDVTQISE